MTYTHCFSLSSTSLTNFSRGGMSRQVSGESAWAERSRGVNTEDPQIGNVQNLKPWKKNTFQNCKEKPTKITVGNSTISVHSFWVDDSKPGNCQIVGYNRWLQMLQASCQSTCVLRPNALTDTAISHGLTWVSCRSVHKSHVCMVLVTFWQFNETIWNYL